MELTNKNFNEYIERHYLTNAMQAKWKKIL